MAAGNFEKCLAQTLKWEGGYSNHPDDPGGPTMRGVIQREYDAWRGKHGKRARPVHQIEENELREIYRSEYWDAMGCDQLPAGMDLCVFDAAVNSGAGRARGWLAQETDIDDFCNARMAFLRRLGRLWRVFGTGWTRRVADIRNKAHLMAGRDVTVQPEPLTLHAGMRCAAVRVLQSRLRALGYPCGGVDGIFGEQTYRAVVLFQHDNELEGETGIWLPAYDAALESAKPMLSRRTNATQGDLDAAGDQPVRNLNLLQRILAWIFGASAAAQTLQGSSVLDSVNGLRSILEPVQSLMGWLGGNVWLIVAVACVALIALVRVMRNDHLEAYRNFGYQGPDAAGKGGALC